MKTLYAKWLLDNSMAFSASFLAGTNLDTPGRGVLERVEQATQVIGSNLTRAAAESFADSTLNLLDEIPPDYEVPDTFLLSGAVPLAQALGMVRSEIELRANTTKRLPEILTAHAVYLLKHSHLNVREFLKWLRRLKEPATREIDIILEALDRDQASWEAIDSLLDFSRDASHQTRDRIDAVDRLYESLPFATSGDNMLWWLRICLALRNALYCWPLMVAGSKVRGIHGISLPIGLFLSPNGESKVYFRIVNPGDATEHRRYVPRNGDVWAHMEGSNLQWNGEWAKAFQLGLEVAKTLWRTQNGRLRFADEAVADAILNASLVVDLGAACAIVGEVFRDGNGAPYRLTGRSAEAYWVQTVLGMMLPGRELPLGIVTGRVEVADGAYELHHVDGISKKLEYANTSGFSRVILPSPQFDDADDMNTATSVDTLDAGNTETATHLVDQEPPTLAETGASSHAPASPADDNGNLEDRTAEAEVQAFLKSLAESNVRKRIEINFCQNLRNVADAMQMSGWRRTAFVRLCPMQRTFSLQLRRLFLAEQVRERRPLSSAERRFYSGSPWTSADLRGMQQLDRYLLSDTRAIKFVDRARFDDAFPEGAEGAIGKWLAWKDHQVRGGSESGMRGPGLGIFCLRTTETDNEARLWSTIADTLAASPQWWNAFQWSSVDQAANLLTRLLCNRRADPAVSSTPAPDLLVLLDEGNLTQRRTNPVFPDDFRGQWLDLLNPSKDDQSVFHHLNDAFRREGEGILGPTRIIVIYGSPSAEPRALPPSLDALDREALERLAVFRFDFSIQSAYALLNYKRPLQLRLAWTDVDEKLQTLIAKKVVYKTRGRYYVAPQLLSILREGVPYSESEAHVTAAKSLTPILEPRNLFISSNRDRTLEPENVLEATWHLHRARLLIPPRDRRRSQCEAALSALTFLRPFPDWDTVKQLGSPATLGDAVEVGRELLSKELSVTGRPPHTSRVAALLNALGDFGRSLNGPEAESRRIELAHEARRRFAEAVHTLDALSVSDARRQKRKLFSEYIYCMKMLSAPDLDGQVSGAQSYLAGTVTEVVNPDFYDIQDLDDYPLSRDWLRMSWSETELTLRERSTQAYVAARLHVGRWRDGVQVRDPWDQPWIEYFALTTTKDFFASQLHSPLVTWDQVYGGARESAERFGQRVRDFVSYLSPRNHQELSWWGSKIRSAVDNLWDFINHPDAAKRLRSYEADVALRLLGVVVMPEVLPAFDFLERRGEEWLSLWPERLGQSWSEEWNQVTKLVIGSAAGWVSMLSSLREIDDGEIELARSWLHAFRKIGTTELDGNDPERLVERAGTKALVDAYRRKKAAAVWSGYQLLAQRNGHGWAIYGELRIALQNILQEMDGTTNSWFFAIATREPERRSVFGASLLLQQHASDASLRNLKHAGMEGLKAQLRRNLSVWADLWQGRDGGIFEDLKEQFSARTQAKGAAAGETPAPLRGRRILYDRTPRKR